MTTRNSILVWWTSRVCLNQRGITTCRCLARLSSEFVIEDLWRSYFERCECQRRNVVFLETFVDACAVAIPQDSPGAGLPRWYGWWESRRKSQEDQAAQDVLQQRYIKYIYTNKHFTWSFIYIWIWICVSSSYVMTNGYKPAPLDLNHVKLTPNQNQLVEKLAENGHNVWARDRVRQGWTYSIVQVTISNPFSILNKSFIFNGELNSL